jgi:hypothetical protein
MTSYDISLRPGNIWKLQFLILSSTRMGGQGSGSVRSGTLIPIKKDACTFSTDDNYSCNMLDVFSIQPRTLGFVG